MARERNVPKFLIDRILPDNGISSPEPGILKVTIINAFKPIAIDNIPANIWDFLDFSINSKKISTEVKRVCAENSAIIWEGKEYKFEDLKSLIGTTIPIGAQIIFLLTCPPELELKKGKNYLFSVQIRIKPPLLLGFSRKIN